MILHRFPRNEASCKQWVKEIGREGWMPTDSSFICSDHFPENSITECYSRKRLKPGNNNDVLATFATTEEVPEPIMVVECNHSPTTSNQTLGKDFSSPCTSKTANVREKCQICNTT
ncbi:THAP domain-containing protein 3-like isoform X2 [Halictus rubicundus]|uniref:THAP domain-containing protein 3-like isoform X2 n=1 Tax=Halictus rubicundus TaxID=77578 RepID=UPI004036596B